MIARQADPKASVSQNIQIQVRAVHGISISRRAHPLVTLLTGLRAHTDSAASAVRNLNDYEIMNRKLRVDFSNDGGEEENACHYLPQTIYK